MKSVSEEEVRPVCCQCLPIALLREAAPLLPFALGVSLECLAFLCFLPSAVALLLSVPWNGLGEQVADSSEVRRE